MKKEHHVMLAIHVTDRVHHVSQVQSLLTEYGNYIQTRLGLHETGGRSSANGIIVLYMVGGEKVCSALARKLNKIEGVEAQKIVFRH
ncbi:MAG TPA: hypothetical protein VLH60_00575 [Sedimentisphaerales bacterium]|nr:hypothetical protein [Sedimentisphaerales bacterium]